MLNTLIKYCLLLLLVILAFPLQAQQESPDMLAEKRIVMIRSRLDAGTTSGAGIIIGWGNGRVYIVTAAHVVRNTDTKLGLPANDITVEFRDLPGEPVKALPPLQHWDDERDLAMLAVDSALLPEGLLDRLPLLAIGDLSALNRRDDVSAIGYKENRPWNVLIGSQFSELEVDTIIFATYTIDVGASGGGLYNENWELIGMVTETESSEARAVRIDRILELLKQWNYPLEGPRTAESAPVTSSDPATPVTENSSSPELVTVTVGYPCEAGIVVSSSPASMLNQVRTLPAINAPLVTAVRQGSDVTVNKQMAEGSNIWYEISYGLVERNRTGWLPSLYLELSPSCPTSKQSEPQVTESTENSTINTIYPCDANVVISTSAGTGLNQVRTAPGIGAPMTYPVRQGSTVSVTEKADTADGVWYKIAYSYNEQERTGWLPTRYLELAATCPQ